MEDERIAEASQTAARRQARDAIPFKEDYFLPEDEAGDPDRASEDRASSGCESSEGEEAGSSGDDDADDVIAGDRAMEHPTRRKRQVGKSQIQQCLQSTWKKSNFNKESKRFETPAGLLSLASLKRLKQVPTALQASMCTSTGNVLT